MDSFHRQLEVTIIIFTNVQKRGVEEGERGGRLMG